MNYLVKKLNKKDCGFTLIELIVVIGILAILAALAIPAVAGYLENSKARTNVSNAKIIYNAAQAFLAANPDLAAVVDTDLTDNGYLATIPTTAERAGYGLAGDGSAVTWTAETSLAAENPDGVTVPTAGTTELSYPE